MTAFVLGATGFVGREVVRQLAVRGRPVIAHVRPDSKTLAEWRAKLTALGAIVDTTPWQVSELAARLRDLAPDAVYILIGTTRTRAKSDHVQGNIYEAVDYGLTQLAVDAINHQWRRHVIEFNRDRQRALWRDWKIDDFAPWQMVAAVAAGVVGWAIAVLLAFALRRKRRERAIALWESVCRRLARAGLPRLSYEGPLAFSERAALRWPQFDIAFRAIGESFAALRYGTAASRASERAALLATLERAIDALPRSSRLRAMN